MTLRLLFDEIRTNVKQICTNLGYSHVEFEVSEASRPEFGDVSCNIGFLLAKPLKKKPFDIAESIASEFKKIKVDLISQASAHPSGYLNFTANYPVLIKSVMELSSKENYV